jgi:hypothetical protein
VSGGYVPPPMKGRISYVEAVQTSPIATTLIDPPTLEGSEDGEDSEEGDIPWRTTAVVSPLNSILQPSDVTFSEHIHSKDLHNSVIHFIDVLLDLFSPLLGSDYDTYIRFLDVFSEFRHIPGHNCWSSNVPKIKNVCNSVEERATDT